MNDHFFEIVFQVKDFTFEGRDEVEEPLDLALKKAGLGEVTGGGSGGGIANIDVEAEDFQKALNVIRQVLANLNVASSTYINYYNLVNDTDERYQVYD